MRSTAGLLRIDGRRSRLRIFSDPRPRIPPLAREPPARQEWPVTCAYPTTQRPRLVLADDHRETAEQLRKLLQPHFEVVEVVEDGRGLVAAAAQFSPDAIVADLSMPFLDGIEAASLILGRDPAARIVLVTVHAEAMLVERGLAAGALGYVLKDAAGDELVDAVRAALGGQRYVSRSLRGPNDDDVPGRPENKPAMPASSADHVQGEIDEL
jgi:DNA-binding NarL/FixJ family response regulator